MSKNTKVLGLICIVAIMLAACGDDPIRKLTVDRARWHTPWEAEYRLGAGSRIIVSVENVGASTERLCSHELISVTFDRGNFPGRACRAATGDPLPTWEGEDDQCWELAPGDLLFIDQCYSVRPMGGNQIAIELEGVETNSVDLPPSPYLPLSN